jgi:hypothetical protein
MSWADIDVPGIGFGNEGLRGIYPHCPTPIRAMVGVQVAGGAPPLTNNSTANKPDGCEVPEAFTAVLVAGDTGLVEISVRKLRKFALKTLAVIAV